MLKPIRRPRPFAGKRGESLSELYSAAFGALGISTITPIAHEHNKRYNTLAVVVRAMEKDVVTDAIEVLYNRQSLTSVLKIAGVEQPTEGRDNDFVMEFPETAVHPLSPAVFLSLLNGKYRCDFETTDIIVTPLTEGSYKIAATADSLGYFGEVTIRTEGGGGTIIVCDGAPSTIMLPFSVPEELEPSETGIVEVKIGGVVIFTGSVFGDKFIDAMEDHGIIANVMPMMLPPKPPSSNT